MPPRFAYWTIILDGAPSSFRARERDEILPLFNQFKAKNPAALLKWFSGGTLWDSPEQAKETRALEKVKRFREERTQQAKPGWSPGSSDPGSSDPLAEFRRQHGRPADGSDDPSTRGGSERSLGAGPSSRPDRRGKDWRPGGEHRDPRDKYKLPPGEARKRWKERNLPSAHRQAQGRPEQGRGATRDGQDRSLRTGKPFGGKPPGPGGPRRFDERREGGKPFEKPFSDRPRGDRPFGSKPGGDRPYGDRPRGDRPYGGKPGGDRPFGDRPRGPKPFGAKPRSDRPFGGPSTRDGQDRSLRSGKPGGDRRFGDRPHGDRPRGPKPFGSKPAGPRPYRGKPGKPRGPRGKG